MPARPLALTAVLLTLSAGPTRAADVEPTVYAVGVAAVDITPDGPIRLNGFGFRRAECEGVADRIWAKALAVQHPDGSDPVVLITAEVLGVTADVRVELTRRLQAKAGVEPDRLAVTATHTHCGPMLSGANPTIFGTPIAEAERQRIDAYTAAFLDKLEAVAVAALKSRKPARLFWGFGSVGLAVNRRRPPGPVDHDLPVLSSAMRRRTRSGPCASPTPATASPCRSTR